MPSVLRVLSSLVYSGTSLASSSPVSSARMTSDRPVNSQRSGMASVFQERRRQREERPRPWLTNSSCARPAPQPQSMNRKATAPKVPVKSQPAEQPRQSWRSYGVSKASAMNATRVPVKSPTQSSSGDGLSEILLRSHLSGFTEIDRLARAQEPIWQAERERFAAELKAWREAHPNYTGSTTTASSGDVSLSHLLDFDSGSATDYLSASKVSSEVKPPVKLAHLLVAPSMSSTSRSSSNGTWGRSIPLPGAPAPSPNVKPTTRAGFPLSPRSSGLKSIAAQVVPRKPRSIPQVSESIWRTGRELIDNIRRRLDAVNMKLQQNQVEAQRFQATIEERRRQPPPRRELRYLRSKFLAPQPPPQPEPQRQLRFLHRRLLQGRPPFRA